MHLQFVLERMSRIQRSAVVMGYAYYLTPAAVQPIMLQVTAVYLCASIEMPVMQWFVVVTGHVMLQVHVRVLEGIPELIVVVPHATELSVQIHLSVMVMGFVWMSTTAIVPVDISVMIVQQSCALGRILLIAPCATVLGIVVRLIRVRALEDMTERIVPSEIILALEYQIQILLSVVGMDHVQTKMIAPVK